MKAALSMMLALLAPAVALAAAPAIRVNQLGFAPGATKLAVVASSTGTTFEVIDDASGKPVLAGKLGAASQWQPSMETVRLADFSSLTRPGSYRLRVAGAQLSDRFRIAPQAYRALNAAALKGYYFNRSGMALDARHAGLYARAAGHPDDKVLVHASAATAARPAGTVLASSKGWYDAGDYNKYIPSSGITTYTLLAAYEHFPSYFAKQDIGIPESGNDLPDILDEALWNLEWMLTMQDPGDGGVYHKLTNKTFDAMVMPDQAMTAPRYVVAKSTAATLDFAATMATAARVLKATRPELALQMLAAAAKAWQWAQANPARTFANPADIATGEYGDTVLGDEWAWAAAELYISTGDDAYYRAMKPESVDITFPEWNEVRGLAWMSLAHHKDRLTPAADRKLIASRIDTLAATLAQQWRTSAYRLSMKAPDFVWGSNAVVLNQAMMLLQGYRQGGSAEYLQAAQSGLDYVLGRNATGYAFVTGFGARPSLYPHHRPSQADTVAAPVPGFVTGGPQPMQQDKKECPTPYPSALPALSYIDHVCSYASNEIAINWNAPLVYVTAALDEMTTTMLSPDLTLAAIAQQEERLQFTSFTNEMALDIGNTIIALARKGAKPVAVDITRNGTQLFFHGMTGTSADHADWIRRKNNLVKRTGHSSFYIHTEVKNKGGDIDAIPTLDLRDFAAHGGAFPLMVRGTGAIGTITVSGLPGPDDHALVVQALETYLKKEGQ
jgi:endoglucanase